MDTKNPDNIERVELKDRLIESDGERFWIHTDSGLVQIRFSATEIEVEVLNSNDQEVTSCHCYASDLELD